MSFVICDLNIPAKRAMGSFRPFACDFSDRGDPTNRPNAWPRWCLRADRPIDENGFVSNNFSFLSHPALHQNRQRSARPELVDKCDFADGRFWDFWELNPRVALHAPSNQLGKSDPVVKDQPRGTEGRATRDSHIPLLAARQHRAVRSANSKPSISS